MKTLFMVVVEELETRNLLRGDFYGLVKSRSDLRLVIFARSEKVASYRNMFAHDKCVVEPIIEASGLWLPIKKLFRLIALSSIPTRTIWFRQTHSYREGGSFVSFLFKRVFWTLGHLSVWRSFLRFVEYVILREDISCWRDYFSKYRPDLVYIPAMHLEAEISMLKYAKRKSVPSVGMTLSWDNITSKLFMRIFPDKLLVQNNQMVEEAQSLCDFPKDRIRVVGFPQFDHYFDSDWIMSKEDLALKLGLDPALKWITIFTGGLSSSVLNWEGYGDFSDMLDKKINEGVLPNASVLVKMHPNDHFLIKKPVNGKILSFGKNFEFGSEDTKMLINLYRWSSVTINFGSTAALEAAIFNTPIILGCFNGYGEESTPWHKKLSVALFNTSHYLDMINTGGMRCVHNEKELMTAVSDYLKDPSLDQAGRESIVRKLAGPLDSKAAQRVFNLLLS